MKTDTCPFLAEERSFKLHERGVRESVAGYEATRFNTCILGPALRGEYSFSFKKRKFIFFPSWIKDFHGPKTRKLTHVCRIIPKSTLLRSMNNVITRRSRVFQIKFA